MISIEEGLKERISFCLVLGKVEERLLSLVGGEDAQVESVEGEPVSHADSIVIMSLLPGYLWVDIIVHHSLVHLSVRYLCMVDLNIGLRRE